MKSFGKISLLFMSSLNVTARPVLGDTLPDFTVDKIPIKNEESFAYKTVDIHYLYSNNQRLYT